MDTATTNTWEDAREPGVYASAGASSFQAPQSVDIHIGAIESVLSVLVLLMALGAAWGRLRKAVGHIETTLEDRVLPDLKDVRERMASMEGTLSALWSTAPQSRKRKHLSTGKRTTMAR